jgi:DsbC/DsbD-like thiol-disulfide interchange protein
MKRRISLAKSAGKSALVIALAIGSVPALQARAASTDWIETDGARIRLSALAPTDDGTIQAVLDVDLLPGWKTYWKDPGEAGVPPSLAVERSENITSAEIHFPAPERISDDYSTWAGYKYPVLFPITLRQHSSGKASVLKADLFLGICQDICIPFQTSFTLELDPDTPANAFEKRLVRRAFRALPEPPDDSFQVLEHAITEDGQSMVLSIQAPDGEPEPELFVTGLPGWRLDTPKVVGRDADVVTFRVDVGRQPEGETLAGQSVNLLVKASGRAIETQLDLPD